MTLIPNSFHDDRNPQIAAKAPDPVAKDPIDFSPSELRAHFNEAVEKSERTHHTAQRECLRILSGLVQKLQDIDLPATLDTSKFCTAGTSVLTLGPFIYDITFIENRVRCHRTTAPSESQIQEYIYLRDAPSQNMLLDRMLTILAGVNVDEKAMTNCAAPEKNQENRRKMPLLGNAPQPKVKSPEPGHP